jgi:glycosyltransferase involved in cell wall biosynthesis
MAGMRVLHVVATGQRRGGEIFATDLIRALDRLGTRQHVAILRPSNGPSIDFGVQATMLSGRGFTPPRRLRSLVHSWQPHVIQAHGGEAMKASVLAFTVAPIVYRRIGGAPPRLRGGWRSRVYRHLVSRTARVVAVAEAVRRESIALLGSPPDRTITIPNAVDVERLVATAHPSLLREELGIDPRVPVFLSVGALSWEKDPLALLNVAADVLERVDEAVYVIVGDGPMRSRLEAEVAVRGLHQRVRILGVRSDVPDLLSMADALLFASRPDGMEGMPASIIEAGMLSTPAVAYDVAGVGEVVTDGLTGRLVRWGDERALSGAMIEILGDEDARATMGAAARERCLADFSIENVAPRYLHVYLEVLACCFASCSSSRD